MKPPRVGPRIGATMIPMAKTAMAAPRRAGGKLSRRTAWAIGWSAPPPTPCTMRATMSMPRPVAAPQAADAAVKVRIEMMRMRLRPKVPASQPVVGRTMALATR